MKKIKIEYLFYLMIIISPFLDASSFLYRGVYPNASFSLATIIRPLIPLFLGLYIFFKDKKERKRIVLFSFIYLFYGLCHLVLYKNNYTDFSYGNVFHEFQYIMNYTYMIGVFYVSYYFYKNKELKYLKRSLLIMFISYLALIYISIVTGTSSPTYIEGIGYKGWFASGNALSSILVLSFLTLLPYLFSMKNKIIVFIVLLFSFIYLTFLIGTRVGLYGFYLSIILFILINLFVRIKNNKKVDIKKYIIPIAIIILIGICGITLIGSKTLERRKHLQSIENDLIDPNTNELSHVTGDLANFVYKINNNILNENYMLNSQKQALLEMYKWANKNKILNNNQRLQQIVYHTYLVKYQKDITLLIFGNGYEINYPELTLEMEIPALLFNFGILGFILYFIPFLIIDIYSIYYLFKYYRKITVEYLTYMSSAYLAIAFSFLAGYTFFNVSSMLIIILIHILLIDQINKIKTNSNDKKRIVFGITSITLGGAERVLVDICNELKNKYDITIFTLYGQGEFEKELDKNIEIISMNKKKYDDLSIFRKKIMSLFMILKPLRYLIYFRYIKNKYDVEIAFLEGPISWIFAFNSNSKKIAWIHNDITNVFGEGKNAKLKLKLSEKCYNNYDKLVFVSEDNKEKFNTVFKIDNYQTVIFNYLNREKVIEKANLYNPSELQKEFKNFVVVSRLTEQKGIERLIDVHEKLVKDGLLHYIYYIGDGPLKEKLSKMIEQKKLNTFKLLGKKDNPYPYIKKADYFLLASLYEGYGMVIDEAKILNKYIIITDTAAREAVKDYKNSLIVENSFDGLYNGLKDKIVSKKDKTVKYNYNNNKIIEQIIDLIER